MNKPQKDLCGSVLEELANLTDTWNRMLLREGRSQIQEKYVNREYFGGLITWLKGILKGLRKTTFFIPGKEDIRHSLVQSPRLSQMETPTPTPLKNLNRLSHQKKKSEGSI